MKWSKDILTYLLFVAIAFLIWWTNAWHNQAAEHEGTAMAQNAQTQADESKQMVTEKLFELPMVS